MYWILAGVTLCSHVSWKASLLRVPRKHSPGFGIGKKIPTPTSAGGFGSRDSVGSCSDNRRFPEGMIGRSFDFVSGLEGRTLVTTSREFERGCRCGRFCWFCKGNRVG